MRSKSTRCTCDPDTVCDPCQKDAAGKADRKRQQSIDRARDNVIVTARVIAEADYGHTYPDLHKAFARLDRTTRSA